MLSRAVVFFFAFLSLFASSQIYDGMCLNAPTHRHNTNNALPLTAPVNEIAARQIGNVQCNIDRLSIVGDLAGLQNTLSSLSSAATSAKSVLPLPLFAPL